MFKLLREFAVLFQIISFVFCNQTITVHAISSPLFSTRKSSSQRELHSPKISGIFCHFSSPFCLVVACSSAGVHKVEWFYEDLQDLDRKSTRLNSSHSGQSRMPSSA